MTIVIADREFKNKAAAATSLGLSTGRFWYLWNSGQLDRKTGTITPPKKPPNKYPRRKQRLRMTILSYVDDAQCDLNLMPYGVAVCDLQDIWTCNDALAADKFPHIPADVIERVRGLAVGDTVSFAKPPWPLVGRVMAVGDELTVTV